MATRETRQGAALDTALDRERKARKAARRRHHAGRRASVSTARVATSRATPESNGRREIERGNRLAASIGAFLDAVAMRYRVLRDYSVPEFDARHSSTLSRDAWIAPLLGDATQAKRSERFAETIVRDSARQEAADLERQLDLVTDEFLRLSEAVDRGEVSQAEGTRRLHAIEARNPDLVASLERAIQESDFPVSDADLEALRAAVSARTDAAWQRAKRAKGRR